MATDRTAPAQTAPGLEPETAQKIIELLQDRLYAVIDLQLTLKHVHWNVVGPNFIGVHEMLDPQVDAVREMSDQLAERIATLGGSPVGTPGALVAGRRWKDYALQRNTVPRHLAALDSAYSGVIADHRSVIADLDSLDLVTQDLVIGHVEKLELQQWFLRAHIEDPDGTVRHP